MPGKIKALNYFQEETLPLTTDSARLEASEKINFCINTRHF